MRHSHPRGAASLKFILVALLCVAGAAAMPGCSSFVAPGPTVKPMARPENPPDSEFRALFVTTAYNLDWPSKPGLPASVQKDEITAIVTRAQNLNCNAILLQVRAFGDRIYQKSILDGKYDEELWSMSLNFGSDPGYDPLQEWIDACREADIELHFWINPFRVNNLVKIKNPDPTKPDLYLPVIVYKENPLNDKEYNQLWLDPNNSYVRQYVKDVVAGLMKYYGNHANSTMEIDVAKGPVIKVEEGGDGTIYDHYIPDDGSMMRLEAQGQSTPKAAATAAATAAAKTEVHCPDPADPASTQPVGANPAEQRVNWLYKKYVCVIKDEEKVTKVLGNQDPAGMTLDKKMEQFMQESAAIVRPHGRFGYTPTDRDDDTHKAWAQDWLSKNYFDYMVPEIYMKRGSESGSPPASAFRKRVQNWLSKVPPGPTTQPFISPGLATMWVQTPKHGEVVPWPADEIINEMADVRKAKSGDTTAAGEAHYSASALRTTTEGGPRPGKNLVPKLTAQKTGHYEKPTGTPDSHRGPKPATPAPTIAGGIATWPPSAGAHHYIVVPWIGNQPQKPERPKDRSYTLKSGEDAVWVKGVSSSHRHSDFGKTP